MLRYRGAREWCRIHEPGLMLGVYGDDEMEEMNARFAAARVINEDRNEPPAPANDLLGPPAPTEEATSGEVAKNSCTPPADDETEENKSERRWLSRLEENFAKAEDIAELADMQDQLMTHRYDEVSEQAWGAAQEIVRKNAERLEAAE
jgi:hypothetical protein